MPKFRKILRKLTCFGTLGTITEDIMTPEPPLTVHDEVHKDVEVASDLFVTSTFHENEPQKCPLPDLPVELLNDILSFSSSHDLCQVAKSNSLCFAIATRLLYRDIELNHPVKTIKCIRTLASSRSPTIPLHVRKFHVGDNMVNGSEVLPAFYKLLHRALLRMHNLVSLSLLVGGPNSFVLTGCSFRLKSFTTACHWDKHLVKWLEEQDEITSALFCGTFHHGCSLSQTSMPRLKRISASPLILAAVVPGRPVEEAELCLIHPWLLNSDIISTTLRILAYSSSSVNTLQFITHITDDPQITLGALRAVPEHLPKLSSLAIHIVRGSVTADVLSGLSHVFSFFTSLRSVMILSKNSEDALHDEDMTNPLAKLWHQSCKSLELVSFPDSVWVRNPRLGWVTLKDLERILSEREKELEKKEKELSEREQDVEERENDLKKLALTRKIII